MQLVLFLSVVCVLDMTHRSLHAMLQYQTTLKHIIKVVGNIVEQEETVILNTSLEQCQPALSIGLSVWSDSLNGTITCSSTVFHWELLQSPPRRLLHISSLAYISHSHSGVIRVRLQGDVTEACNGKSVRLIHSYKKQSDQATQGELALETAENFILCPVDICVHPSLALHVHTDICIQT